MVLAASWPWHWSASAWSSLTFLVFAATVLYARRQAIEARRLREQQAQPFVLIDFSPVSQSVIEIVVTNIGATLARDVRFEFDPQLASSHDTEPGYNRVVAELTMFKDGIPSLAPGKEMRVFFDRFPSRMEAKLPMAYHVTVSYRDVGGRSHVEEQVLDLDVYRGTGGVTRYGLHDVHHELKRIAEKLERWTDWYGLKIVSQADLDQRHADWERQDAERVAAQAEHSPSGAGESGEAPDAHSLK